MKLGLGSEPVLVTTVGIKPKPVAQYHKFLVPVYQFNDNYCGTAYRMKRARTCGGKNEACRLGCSSSCYGSRSGASTCQ